MIFYDNPRFLTPKPTSMQQTKTNLRQQISGFLRHMHAEAGNSIQHVTIVVHGQPWQLEDDLYTEQLTVSKMEGASSLSYQQFRLADAPIDNNITFIATQPVKTPKTARGF